MIDFRLVPVHRLRIATFSGIVGDDELVESYRDLIAEPDYDLTFDDLVDLTPLVELRVTSDAVRRLVALFEPYNHLGVTNRLAIVAPRDYMYGMARMYQLLRSEAPEQTMVFRSLDEAAAWLEVDDLDLAPPESSRAA